MEVEAQQHESAGPWEWMSGSPYPWELSPSLQGAECHADFICKGVTVFFSQRSRI